MVYTYIPIFVYIIRGEKHFLFGFSLRVRHLESEQSNQPAVRQMMQRSSSLARGSLIVFHVTMVACI